MEYDNCAHPRWTVERRMAEVLAWPPVSPDRQDCDVTERMVMLTRKVVEAAHGLGMPWPNIWRGPGGINIDWRGKPIGQHPGERWRILSVDVDADDADENGDLGCVSCSLFLHSAWLTALSSWSETTLGECMTVAASFWRGEPLAWVYAQPSTGEAPSLYHPDRCDGYASGPFTCNPYPWHKPTPLPREALCRHG